MNAVLMDDVVIGEECIVGALTFIKAGEQIPRRSMVVGNPGRIVKEVSDEMIAWKTAGTKVYQQLPAMCYETLIAIAMEDLESSPFVPASETTVAMDGKYKIWKNLK
jgi:phenylacetic acid degradation protein